MGLGECTRLRHGTAFTPSHMTTNTPHWLQRQLSLPHPILQAPMAGSQDHQLAVAVARAGGLGALAAATLTPDGLVQEIKRFRQAIQAPLNVNFFCHQPPEPSESALQTWHQALAPYYREMGLDPNAMPRGAGRQPFTAQWLDVLQTLRPEVVSFHFGLPEPRLLAAVKATGALVLSSATTAAEALWLAENGADAIIAQGLEAGGHRGHFLSPDLNAQSGLMSLLPQLATTITRPIIAAGGIASPQAVQACQALGAAAVQVGTAFLRTPEACTTTLHRAALAQAANRPTTLTHLFTGRPARGLINRIMKELGPLNPAAPAFPLATAALAPLRERAEQAGLDDFSPLWAGQSASQARVQPAGEVVTRLASGWQ